MRKKKGYTRFLRICKKCGNFFRGTSRRAEVCENCNGLKQYYEKLRNIKKKLSVEKDGRNSKE